MGEFALKIQPEHPEKDEKDEGENLPGRRPCPEAEEPDEAEHPAKPPPRREPAGVAGGTVRRAPGRERRAHHRDNDIKDIDEQQRAGREHWQIAGLVGVGGEIHRFNPAGVVEQHGLRAGRGQAEGADHRPDDKAFDGQTEGAGVVLQGAA